MVIMNSVVRTLQPITQQPVLALSVSPDGQQIAVGQQGDYSGATNLSLWDIESLQLIVEIERAKYESIETVCYSPDGKTLAYVIDKNKVSLYDVANQLKLERNLLTPQIIRFSYAKHCNRLVTVGMVTEIWDTNSYERIWLLPDYVALPPHKPAMSALTSDGTQIAVFGQGENQIFVYNIDQSELNQKIEDTPSEVHRVGFSVDSRYLAAIGHLAKGIYVWDFQNGTKHLPKSFNSAAEGYWSFCFHPGNQYFAVGTLVGYVVVFRMNDGKVVVSHKAHEGRIWDLSFTPDGKYLISGGDDGLVRLLAIDY